MTSDDDNFWSEYLADRHQLSSQLSAASRPRRQKKTNRCHAADVKGNCDCTGKIARINHG